MGLETPTPTVLLTVEGVGVACMKLFPAVSTGLVHYRKASCGHFRTRDGNGYPLPAYPMGKNPIKARVWVKKIPMGT